MHLVKFELDTCYFLFVVTAVPRATWKRNYVNSKCRIPTAAKSFFSFDSECGRERFFFCAQLINMEFIIPSFELEYKLIWGECLCIAFFFKEARWYCTFTCCNQKLTFHVFFKPVPPPRSFIQQWMRLFSQVFRSNRVKELIFCFNES